MRTKNLLTEFERKEKVCNRKWNALLVENTVLQRKVLDIEESIINQKAQFQHSVNQVEKNLLEANKRLAQ